MSENTKTKKVKPLTKKVIRKVPNINLLKHLNVVLLLSGFLSSFVIIGILSSNSAEKYDVRSRGQVKPTVIPTPATSSGPWVTGAITPTIFQKP